MSDQGGVSTAMPQYLSTYRDEFTIADGSTCDRSVNLPQVTATDADPFAFTRR